MKEETPVERKIHDAGSNSFGTVALNSSQPESIGVICLVVFQTLSNLLFFGCIFGYASLQLLFEEDGVFANLCSSDAEENNPCDRQIQALLLVYTLGSSFQVFSSFPVGFILDFMGPVFCTVLGGTLIIAGLLCIGLAHTDSIATFVTGSVLISLGGTVSFLTSFLLGFVVPPRRVSVVMTALNCAFDGSTCIFLFFYLIYHRLNVSRSALFIGYSIIAALIYTCLFFLWMYVGNPIVIQRKIETALPSSNASVEMVNIDKDSGDGKTTLSQLEKKDDYAQVIQKDDMNVIIDVTIPVVDKEQSTDREDIADADVNNNIETEKHTDYHKLHWYQQLTSARFICIAIYGSIHIFRSNAFMGIIKNILYLLGDEDTGYLITTLYCIILPLGGLFIPLIDYIIFNNSFVTSLHICTLFGVIYGVLILIPLLRLQILTFIIFCFFRALFFSIVGTYSVQIFGPINAGRTYGMVWMFGAILNLMVWPSLIIIDEYAGGSYVPFNAFLLSISLPAFLSTQFVLKPALERVSGGAWPTR